MTLKMADRQSRALLEMPISNFGIIRANTNKYLKAEFKLVGEKRWQMIANCVARATGHSGHIGRGQITTVRFLKQLFDCGRPG